MRVAAPRVSARVAVLAGGLAAAALFALLGAAGARAAELVYFENNPLQSQIAVVDAGSGSASLLNASGAELEFPEGLSYDPVTNRLYVASGNDRIAYINLDGSGGGVLPVPATVPLEDPRGVVVDPVARIAYWVNTPFMQPYTISWARLDGSEGGELPLGGQPLVGTIRLTLDPAAGRLYWGDTNEAANGTLHYAPLIGSSGIAGELEAQSNGHGAGFQGIAVDSASAQIFWVEFGINAVWRAGLGGTAKGEVISGVSPAIDQPYGLAYDPGLNRLYWANFGVNETPKGALGFAAPGGPASEITPTGVAVDNPHDVLVIKSPTAGKEAPQLTLANGRLQCSQGSWGSDYVSSFVYQSPRSFSYSWTHNGATLPGASEAVYTPTESGSYACVVSASNQAGSTSESSASSKVTVTAKPKPVTATTKPVAESKSQGKRAPANLVLAGARNRHLRARPGKLLILRVRAVNEGNVASISSQVCLRLAKRTKRALRAGKCRQLGPLGGGNAATAKLRLRVKRSAQPGVYRLRIAVPGDQTKVTVHVLG